MRRAAISGLLAATFAGATARAQSPRLAVDLPAPPDPPPAVASSAQLASAGSGVPLVRSAPAGATGPAVRAMDVLNDGQTRDLLRNGFPARLHFRLELWHAGGIFNALDGTREWDVVVRYDPLQKRYRAARLQPDTVIVLANVDNYAALAAAVAAPDTVSLVPGRHAGRYYYNAVLDVEMLSLSDLDEVERWLRGELGPGLRGHRNPGGVLGRGIRTLFVHLLGAERRHYEIRSKTFATK